MVIIAENELNAIAHKTIDVYKKKDTITSK